MEEGHREHRDDDRRRHRDQAEQADEARVQARARRVLPARHDQLGEAPRHQHAEQQQQDDVEIEEAEHQIDVGAEPEPAGQGDVGGDARQRCRDGQHHREPRRDVLAAQPGGDAQPGRQREQGERSGHGD